VKPVSEIIDTHAEYNRLLREYQDAKQEYELDDSNVKGVKWFTTFIFKDDGEGCY